MTWLTDPLSVDFMVRALVGGGLAAVLCAVVGTWVLVRGMAFLGEALGEVIAPLQEHGCKRSPGPGFTGLGERRQRVEIALELLAIHLERGIGAGDVHAAIAGVTRLGLMKRPLPGWARTLVPSKTRSPRRKVATGA